MSAAWWARQAGQNLRLFPLLEQESWFWEGVPQLELRVPGCRFVVVEKVVELVVWEVMVVVLWTLDKTLQTLTQYGT